MSRPAQDDPNIVGNICYVSHCISFLSQLLAWIYGSLSLTKSIVDQRDDTLIWDSIKLEFPKSCGCAVELFYTVYCTHTLFSHTLLLLQLGYAVDRHLMHAKRGSHLDPSIQLQLWELYAEWTHLSREHMYRTHLCNACQKSTNGQYFWNANELLPKIALMSCLTSNQMKTGMQKVTINIMIFLQIHGNKMKIHKQN